MQQEKGYIKRVDEAIQDKRRNREKLKAREKELDDEIASLQAENRELEKLMKLGGTLGEARATQYTVNMEELRFLETQLSALLDELIATEEDDIDLTKQRNELKEQGKTVAES